MAFPERVFDSSEPESEPQAPPHLNIVDSAAEAVRASMADERASDEAMPREPVGFPTKQTYVGETPQEVHAQYNEAQIEAARAARRAGEKSTGPAYSAISTEANQARFARLREQDPGYKGLLAQIRADAQRERENP